MQLAYNLGVLLLDRGERAALERSSVRSALRFTTGRKPRSSISTLHQLGGERRIVVEPRWSCSLARRSQFDRRETGGL
jgi:hypothetical protein